ncbi:MAG: xanthine dehydrogenase [Bacillota bacterium]|jgi:xanthine dehydrogenase accessory factor|nr:xanthine dehydrogenase [Bacillota bacterium]
MSASIYLRLKNELDHGRKAVMITKFSQGQKEVDHTQKTDQIKEFDHIKDVVLEKTLMTEEQLLKGQGETLQEKARHSLETGCLQFFQSEDSTCMLIEPYEPMSRLIILGGGAIAVPLAELGVKVGLSVTVVDDRPTYANKDRFPQAETVICDEFSSCLAQLILNEYSFVVIVTREHKHDLECLRTLLTRKTAYTGMIGSKVSLNRVKEQLKQEGFSEEQIHKVHMPVGLDIGADTPDEIAVSIIAQIIQFRMSSKKARGANEPCDPDSNEASARCHFGIFGNGRLETDRHVLNALCRDPEEPRALATVVETWGSVPRKAGAKMLIWSYGMTVGSFGGGYAEGELINAAWQLIGTGSSALHEIDLTGQTDEEEGMVCGGMMKVLIEDCQGL